MIDISINLGVSGWAVFAATVAQLIVGSLWYAPFLFGYPWMREIGTSEEKIKAEGGMARAIGVSAIGAILTSFVLAYLVSMLDVTGAGEAIQIGFWLWLGFFVPVGLNAVSYEKRSWRLFFINYGYHLVNISIAAGLISFWL